MTPNFNNSQGVQSGDNNIQNNTFVTGGLTAERRQALREQYLRAVAERVGWLDLARIAPAGQRVPLESVYIELPVEQAIGIEVRDWRIVDWWITGGRAKSSDFPDKSTQSDKPLTYNTTDIDRSPAALQPLVDAKQSEINAEHIAHEERPLEYRYRHWKDNSCDHAIPLTASDIACACNRLVILGGPGTGKSTVVRHLSLCLAGEGITGWTRASISDIRNWTYGTLTPVYVSLSDFVASSHFPGSDLTVAPTASNLTDYLRDAVLGGCPRIKSGKLSDRGGNRDLAVNLCVCLTSFFPIARTNFIYCRPVHRTGFLKTILRTKLLT